MILKEDKHSKHTALTRSDYGNFGRNEWAIVGAPCADIKVLAGAIVAGLSSVAKIAYADAEHEDEPQTSSGRVAMGTSLEYAETRGQRQVTFNGPLNSFQKRPLFNSSDMVLINGNHYQGKRQVVIIDSKKKASLQKRMLQLTNIRLFLLANGESGPFDFIKEVIPGYQDISILNLADTEQIIRFFKDELTLSKPELYGLVLSGGKSQRMGQDKGRINWHGKDQRYYMADVLKGFTDKVYISCRADQQQEISAPYQTLPDTFTGLGPFGAILSAFREQPDKAWLVVACDLPLLDKDSLNQLIAHRDTSAVATTFESPQSGFPEPLITIWEPKSYAVLLSFLAQGYSCPRKVLINSDTKILQAPNPEALTNVNTPEEMVHVKNILQQKTVTA